MPETRHYCPHCEEKVSLSTIHRHKQLYYNQTTHTWIKSEQDADVLSSDSDVDQDIEVDSSVYERFVEGIF